MIKSEPFRARKSWSAIALLAGDGGVVPARETTPLEGGRAVGAAPLATMSAGSLFDSGALLRGPCSDFLVEDSVRFVVPLLAATCVAKSSLPAGRRVPRSAVALVEVSIALRERSSRVIRT